MSVMDSPPKLTGETLIVHHIPLVHCQVSERQCCGTSKRGNPFCQPDLSITRTTSLPERDLSQTDSLLYSSLIQTSNLPSEASGGAEVKLGDFQGPVGNKRHNPFLLNESEENDIYGDGPGQMSFHLHNAMTVGKSAFHLHELGLPPFHLHDTNNIVKPWSMANRSGVVEGQEARSPTDDIQKRNANRGRLVSERMELDECSFHNDGSSNFPMDCGDPEWNNSSDESLRNQGILHSRTCSCSSSEVQHCRCCSVSSQSEMLDHQMGYISDSSCNSSDGVLVNFSALYNKMNEHSRSNLNSANLSCDSSFCSHSDTGAFYLDLHSSPTESKMSCESHQPENSGKACECHHSSSPVLDANCNSYHLHCPSDSSDLTACFQSQARLVVATQNYYKLVTCDLSSQSSPSPAGSSITSCSEDHTKTSPVQPTEYYLFQRPDTKEGEDIAECFREGEALGNTIEGQVYVNVSPPNLNTGRQRSRSYDRNLDRSPSVRLGSLERMMSCPVKLSDGHTTSTQDSAPKRVTSFAELAKSRKKNGFSPPLRTSGDSSLEFSPIPEFHKGCPLFARDGEHRSHSLPFMPVVPCLNRSSEGSSRGPGFGEGQEVCSNKASIQGATQVFVSQLQESGNSSDGNIPRDPRAKADGIGNDGKPVVRYSRDQRPTTLPIQPFVFQHHFSKTAKPRPLHNHFTSSLSQLYGLSSSRAPSQQNSDDSQSSASATSTGLCMEQIQAQRTLSKRSADGADDSNKKPAPETTRLSPLGSYSPVKSNGTPFKAMDTSSGSLTPERSDESHPPRSRSCPLSANLLPTRSSPARGSTQPDAVQFSWHRPSKAPQEGNSPKAMPKKDVTMEWKSQPSKLSLQPSSLPPLPPLELGTDTAVSQAETSRRISENTKAGLGNSLLSRPLNANHLSPQALKWREYRRKNPLGLEGISGLAGLASSLDRKQLEEPRISRRMFDFPSSIHGSHIHSRLNGPLVKHLHINHSDFFPDFFSLAERPPAEFCLSPDITSESVSVDLVQKKGLVKAVNTAVDLIVAHFGTSRDPGVKAKLGNSSVSPNVGHLIFKYLCPAIRAILSDGLKAYVLDMIIGQRRNLPWSVAEASTQLGPSTKVLHNLYNKISQCPELTNHSMRFNAFIFGLLNIRSLEFWFNHLYNHEDIIWTHYQPVGFLSLSHSVCQALFEELLLLLQPLSLLPFDLDLLFEHHLLQMGREQQQKKEQLRVKQGLQLSVHSTLQLMRTRGGSEDSEGCSPVESGEKAAEERTKGVGAAAGESEKEEEKNVKESGEEVKRDKQAGWWYQLMQSSQVYIERSAEGSKFGRHEKKRKQGGAAAAQLAEGRKVPLPREGVVVGAEACPVAEMPAGERDKALSANKLGKTDPKENNRPSWMGSPPDSVLSELKQSKEQQAGPTAVPQEDKKAAAAGPPESGHGLKWGHLFGSRKLQSEGRQTNRLPSNWLNLDTSVLQLMAQTVSGSIWRDPAPGKELPETVRCQSATQ